MTSPESRGFRKKSKEELEEQVRKSGEDLGVEISPPSHGEDIYGMSEAELKAKYPKRHELYLRSLRPENAGLSDEEQEKEAVERKKSATMIEALNHLDRFIALEKAKEGRDPRETRQLKVFEDLRDFLEQGGTQGYIKLPTGAGKTVVFTKVLDAMDIRTLIVVPGKELVEQTEKSIARFAPKKEVGKVYSGKKKEYEKKVTVTTYQSLQSQVSAGKLSPDDFQLVILDEAHRSLTEARATVAQGFESSLMIGFTATPEFSEEKKVKDLLGSEIHSLELSEAVKLGILSPVRTFIARPTSEVTLNPEDLKNTPESREALENKINTPERNKVALDIYNKPVFNGRTAVVYTAGVKHAETMTALFLENNVAAATFHGELSDKERERILEAYKKGEIKVLCNANVLVEGFDEEKASLCINLRPTSSRVMAEQRAGRVLRLDRKDQDKKAYVIDVLDRYSDENFRPVLFSEILGGATIAGPKREGSEGEEGEGLDPISFEEGEIANAEIVWREEDVLEVMHEMKGEDEKRPPDGWHLAERLTMPGKPKKMVDQLLERVVQRSPEMCGIFEDKQGNERRFCSPQAVEKVQEMLSERPSGWDTASYFIAAKGGRDSLGRRLVEEYLQSIKRDEPQWVTRRARLGQNDQIIEIEYFSPEVFASDRFQKLSKMIEAGSPEPTSEQVEAARETLEEYIDQKGVTMADVRGAVMDLMESGVRPKYLVKRGELEKIKRDGMKFGEERPAYLAREPKPTADEVVIELDVEAKKVMPNIRNGIFKGQVRVSGTVPPEKIHVIDKAA